MSDTTTYGRPFDHKSAFGEVCGDPRYSYEQGGQLYNAHKQPVNIAGDPIPMKPVPQSEKPSAPVMAPALDADPVDEDEAPIEDSVDLKAWAAGEVVAPWQKVRAEIARQTGRTVASKDEAMTVIKSFFEA